MGSHTTAGGQDTSGSTHAFDILRGSLLTDEDDILSTGIGGHGSLGSEDDRADGSTRGSGQALRQDGGLLLGSRIEDRVQDLIQLARGNTHHSGLLVDHALVKHVHRHLKGSQSRALADTALQHVKLTILDRELDILHVVEVVFQQGADAVKLLINLGHRGLEGLEMLVMLGLGGLIERVRGTDTGDHIFALGVDQPLTIELVVTGRRVTGESDTRCRRLTHVAEYHRLDIDSRAPIIGNLLDATVSDSAFAVPRLEHAADGTPQLRFRSVRELDAKHFLDLGFELVAQGLEFICRNLGVGLVATRLLELAHHAVKLLADTLAILRLNAFGFLHHDVGIHHDETTVSVIYETGIPRLLDHARQGRRAKADVEDGVHHTGHRAAGTGTAADEERILGIAEFLAHQGLGSFQRSRNLSLQAVGIAATQGVVLRTALGSDGESCRDRESQLAHLGEVGTLTAEKLAHRAIAFGSLATETVNSLFVVFHLIYVLVILTITNCLTNNRVNLLNFRNKTKNGRLNRAAIV